MTQHALELYTGVCLFAQMCDPHIYTHKHTATHTAVYTHCVCVYTGIVRNKTYGNLWRLRINMGNAYFEQKKYSTAIKMYRMALDQVPPTSKEV